VSRDPYGLAAVLFDMDGTLVDTEGLWWQAAESVAAGLGYRLGEADVDDVLGRPVPHTAAHLHAVTGSDRSPGALSVDLDRRFAELVGKDSSAAGEGGIRPQPGALRLLDGLYEAGVPLALVSASPRGVVDMVLRSLGGWRFALSVSADDTLRSKPAPDPYLAAVGALEAPAAACVAVEDTPTGVSSAEAAGCAVLAVPSRLPIQQGPGRTVVASLEEVDVALLRSLA
jgi:HAD superfamily hydrolase (TIGR01509 family)